MNLDQSKEKLFEKLVSLEYLKLCLKRAKKKKKKNVIEKTIKKMEEEIEPGWNELSQEMQDTWKRQALLCARTFQRSSSCVEGRNGQLSLKFHAFRRIDGQTLNVSTVMHNFFIKRRDRTTAAERFFEQKHQDLFFYLLEKIELRSSREQRKRQAKKAKIA